MQLAVYLFFSPNFEVDIKNALSNLLRAWFHNRFLYLGQLDLIHFVRLSCYPPKYKQTPNFCMC